MAHLGSRVLTDFGKRVAAPPDLVGLWASMELYKQAFLGFKV